MNLDALMHLAWWLPLNAAAGFFVLGPLLIVLLPQQADASAVSDQGSERA